MKNVSSVLSLLLLLCVGVAFIGCDGSDPESSEEETQLGKLKSTWTLSEVKNDGVIRTDEYVGMKLTITGTYTEAGTYNYASEATDWPSVSPWKAVDSWKFKAGSVASIITRQSDLVDMTYSLSNGDNTLTLTFDYSGTGFKNGRTESVSGPWSFTFTK